MSDLNCTETHKPKEVMNSQDKQDEVKLFGWFYELPSQCNGKDGPVYLGSDDEKIARMVAADDGKEPFPLYASPAPQQPVSAAEELLTEIRTALNASGVWHLGMGTVEVIQSLIDFRKKSAEPAAAGTLTDGQIAELYERLDGIVMSVDELKTIVRGVDRYRAALSTQQAEPVKEAQSSTSGWKRVPLEPTPQMMEAGLYQSSHDTKWEDLYSAWKDMLGAVSAEEPAPQQPAAAEPARQTDWQQRALDHGFKYWRAPDAHGVTATQEQALSLLRDLLGVEVDVEGESSGAAAPVAADIAWQPIETVPASKESVLILKASGQMAVETGHYARNMLHASKVDGEECYFTHWMPLPAPPVAAMGTDGDAT